jgi:hypothetical protein
VRLGTAGARLVWPGATIESTPSCGSGRLRLGLGLVEALDDPLGDRVDEGVEHGLVVGGLRLARGEDRAEVLAVRLLRGRAVRRSAPARSPTSTARCCETASSSG